MNTIQCELHASSLSRRCIKGVNASYKAPIRQRYFGSLTQRRPSSEGVCCNATFTLPQYESRFISFLHTTLKNTSASARIFPTFHTLYNTYHDAVMSSGAPDVSEEKVYKVMTEIVGKVAEVIVKPFYFPSHHIKIRSPYDYYELGQELIKYLINFNKSVVGNAHIFARIDELLKNGDNVVLFSNHQSEAEPAVWAHMVQKISPNLAEQIYYISGDRVLDDVIFKPFTMGRNLICVHSKKHFYDDPDLVEQKKKRNQASIYALKKLTDKGGLLLWIAPSGGRDRPNKDGIRHPAAFDHSSVELMRKIFTSAKPKSHFFPLAIHSGDLMPPPMKVERQLGEQRQMRYAAVGIAAGDEVVCDSSDKKMDFTQKVYDEVVNLNWSLQKAVYDAKFDPNFKLWKSI